MENDIAPAAAIFEGHIQTCLIINGSETIGWFIDFADYHDIRLDHGIGYWMILE